MRVVGRLQGVEAPTPGTIGIVDAPDSPASPLPSVPPPAAVPGSPAPVSRQLDTLHVASAASGHGA
jgi:hypothetical protein